MRSDIASSALCYGVYCLMRSRDISPVQCLFLGFRVLNIIGICFRVLNTIGIWRCQHLLVRPSKGRQLLVRLRCAVPAPKSGRSPLYGRRLARDRFSRAALCIVLLSGIWGASGLQTPASVQRPAAGRSSAHGCPCRASLPPAAPSAATRSTK